MSEVIEPTAGMILAQELDQAVTDEKYRDVISLAERLLALEGANNQRLTAALYEKIAMSYAKLGQASQAIEYAQASLARSDEGVEAWFFMAHQQAAQGLYHHALAGFSQALSRNPNNPNPRFNASLMQLKTGQFRQGWENYQYRFSDSLYRSLVNEVFERNAPHLKMAKRDDLKKGCELVLFGEQGLGDHLQFLRYAPLLQHMGIRVWFFLAEVDINLAALLELWPGIYKVLHSRLPVMDNLVKLPLLSLPHLLDTSVETIPPPAPIKPPGFLEQRWAQILQRLPKGPRIGLALQGNPEAEDKVNRVRRIDYGTFASVILPRLSPSWQQSQWIILEKDVSDISRQTLASLPQFHHFPDMMETLPMTAASFASLDAVVSIDTALLHLAGNQLQNNLCGLLPKPSEWRWLVDDQDQPLKSSPWYPTMRLFHQKFQGDWGQPLTELAQHFNARPPKPRS